MQDENTTNVIFARELRALMQRHGHNQVSLADALKVGQSAVSNYLKGRVPRASILQHIAQFYDVLEEQLLNGGVVVGSRSQAWRAAHPKSENVLIGASGKAITEPLREDVTPYGYEDRGDWKQRALQAEKKIETLKKALSNLIKDL